MDDASSAQDGVMHVVLSLVPGGTERLVIDLAKRLSREFRTLVCCLDEAGEWADELTGVGVRVVTLARRPGFHPELSHQIAQLAIQHRARVLHCHHYSPFVYGQIAASFSRGLRVVYTEHGRVSDAPPSPKRRIANAVLARLPGTYFAVSYALRTHVVAEGFPASRVAVIHNGIEPGAITSQADREAARACNGIAPGAFAIGTVARLDPVKDLESLIAALALVRQQVPSAELWIVGDGPERIRLQDAARRGGLEGAVHFAGYRRDARSLMPAWDVFVNSSVTEGVSLTILEAMAAGLPVVATAVGGTPEVVVDGHTGLLVPARSPHALANALLELTVAPDRRGSMGLAGRARVEANFSLDLMVERYARTYAASMETHH